MLKSAIPVPPEVAQGGRWVVERTMTWLPKCRDILIRWGKKAQNYLRPLKLAAGRAYSAATNASRTWDSSLR